MRILIIGGTGNISTSISHRLLEEGHDLTLFTLPEPGEMDSPIPRGANSILGDRTDYEDFEAKVIEAGSFDCVIDMLCYTPEDARSDIRAFGGRIGQLIFTSTVDVYTKPAKRYPVTEDAERQPSPEFPYAFNKAKCERIFEAAHQRGDFPVTFIRPTHTYSRFIIHTFGWGTYFLDRLRRGQPIIVHGDGSSIWVATHSDDVARAYVGVVGNPRTLGKAYHLAADEWMTWDMYHQGLARAIDAPEPTLVHMPTDLLDRVVPKAAEWCVVNFSYNNIFDTTAAKTDLGFRYTIPWEDGARRAYDWLEGRGLVEKSEDYPFYDRVIEAWQRLGVGMARELADVDIREPL
jgi:nucleoside-diphosphate-sugar epimerase